MTETAPRPATYEDLLAAPERLVAEIVNGRLETHPRLAPRYAYTASSLGCELLGPFDKGGDDPGGWWLLDGPELHIGGQVLVPDLAGWRREHMPKLPQTAWFELAPDWVCEVLSPHTARIDRVEKLPIYAEQAVRYAWLIDPDIRTLEAYENRDGHWLLLGTLEEDNPVSVASFDAISFDLSALWAD